MLFSVKKLSYIFLEVYLFPDLYVIMKKMCPPVTNEAKSVQQAKQEV